MKVLLLLWFNACSGSWLSGSKPRGPRPYDYSMSDLRKLYNSRVTFAERFKRPLGNSVNSCIAKNLGNHSGVKITLNNGQKFLVHKGNEYGDASETVVVDAKHMSSRWWSTGEKKNIYHSTVADYIRAGGKNYNLFSDNCHHASKRMMKLN